MQRSENFAFPCLCQRLYKDLPAVPRGQAGSRSYNPKLHGVFQGVSGDLDNSITVVVAADQSGLRLDHLLSEVGTMSRSQAQKLIKAGGVVLNGQVCRPKDQVAEGDEVRYAREGGAEPKFEAKFLPLNIVYEDDDLMVINKDAGVVVHPGAGTGGQVTLAEGVAYYLQSSGINGVWWKGKSKI